jgi:catechol 2,3-dioxygenase-like lactoylglutathione lyase family enzyme
MVLLNDLLKADEFSNAVSGLAKDFRERHALPGIHQLGLVVPNVEAAAVELEEKGMPPFFIAAGSPLLWRERGEERNYRGKLGIAYYHGFELELLEPGEGSDFYRQRIDTESRIVIHHLGFIVPDVDDWAGRLAAKGYPVWVRGRLKAGPMTGNFAYMDTINDTGLVIEFISWRLMGVQLNPPAAIFHALGRLEKWTGKRSISV